MAPVVCSNLTGYELLVFMMSSWCFCYCLIAWKTLRWWTPTLKQEFPRFGSVNAKKSVVHNNFFALSSVHSLQFMRTH